MPQEQLAEPQPLLPRVGVFVHFPASRSRLACPFDRRIVLAATVSAERVATARAGIRRFGPRPGQRLHTGRDPGLRGAGPCHGVVAAVVGQVAALARCEEVRLVAVLGHVIAVGRGQHDQ